MSSFNYNITYRLGKLNLLADTLSWKAEDLQTQKALKQKHQIKILLDTEHIIALVEVSLEVELDIIDQVLTANRSSESLQEYRDKARHRDLYWTMTNQGLLLYEGRLMVPEEGTLQIELLQAIHKDPAYAHPGRTKFRKLVRDQYY